MLIPPIRPAGQMLGRTLDPLDAQDGGPVATSFGFVALDLPTRTISPEMARLVAQSPAKMRQGAGTLPKTSPATGGRTVKAPAGPRLSIPGNGAVYAPPPVFRPGVTLPPVAAPGASDVGATPAEAPASTTSTLAIALAIVAVAWWASR